VGACSVVVHDGSSYRESVKEDANRFYEPPMGGLCELCAPGFVQRGRR
jgi:hypothetical protein